MSEKPHAEIRKNFSCDLIKMLIPYVKFISKMAMVKVFFLNDVYAVSLYFVKINSHRNCYEDVILKL